MKMINFLDKLIGFLILVHTILAKKELQLRCPKIVIVMSSRFYLLILPSLECKCSISYSVKGFLKV